MFSDSATVKLEALKKEFKETEDDLKYLSFTCAERVGEIVKPLDKKRCNFEISLSHFLDFVFSQIILFLLQIQFQFLWKDTMDVVVT